MFIGTSLFNNGRDSDLKITVLLLQISVGCLKCMQYHNWFRLTKNPEKSWSVDRKNIGQSFVDVITFICTYKEVRSVRCEITFVVMLSRLCWQSNRVSPLSCIIVSCKDKWLEYYNPLKIQYQLGLNQFCREQQTARALQVLCWLERSYGF